jgi:hypothetical protein
MNGNRVDQQTAAKQYALPSSKRGINKKKSIMAKIYMI